MNPVIINSQRPGDPNQPTTGFKSCMLLSLKSLPHNKSLAYTKLKAFADKKFDVAKIMISVFERVENFV